MLCAMPDSFFSSVLMDEQSFKLPPLGDYAVGMVSHPWGAAIAIRVCLQQQQQQQTRGLLGERGLVRSGEAKRSTRCVQQVTGQQISNAWRKHARPSASGGRWCRLSQATHSKS